MGYEDFTAGEIIRQEFGAMGYMNLYGGNNNRIIGYNNLSDAGKMLMNGGLLNGDYDYNIFDGNVRMSGDTSYMGIMYNGFNNNSAQLYSGNMGYQKIDWSKSTFSWGNTYGNPVAPIVTTASSGTTASGDGTTTETAKKGKSHKITKGADGKYTVEYSIDGKTATAAEYHEAVGDAAFQRLQLELESLNRYC